MTTLDEDWDSLGDPFPNDMEREQIEELIRQEYPGISEQQLRDVMEALILGENE